MNVFTVPEKGFSLRKALLDIEEEYIDHALLVSEQNVAEAARLLGMNRTTLVEKLRARYPGKHRRIQTRSLSETYANLDPAGEFTYRKPRNGRGFYVDYKGEKLEWFRTLPEVEAFIKEKVDETD